MIAFNINHEVKVKLTPYGVSCLYKNYQKNIAEGGMRFDGFSVNLDEQGYYKTQLWVLMQEFGEHIGMSRIPFEPEIILVAEPTPIEEIMRRGKQLTVGRGE